MPADITLFVALRDTNLPRNRRVAAYTRITKQITSKEGPIYEKLNKGRHLSVTLVDGKNSYAVDKEGAKIIVEETLKEEERLSKHPVYSKRRGRRYKQDKSLPSDIKTLQERFPNPPSNMPEALDYLSNSLATPVTFQETSSGTVVVNLSKFIVEISQKVYENDKQLSTK